MAGIIADHRCRTAAAAASACRGGLTAAPAATCRRAFSADCSRSRAGRRSGCAAASGSSSATTSAAFSDWVVLDVFHGCQEAHMGGEGNEVVPFVAEGETGRQTFCRRILVIEDHNLAVAVAA